MYKQPYGIKHIMNTPYFRRLNKNDFSRVFLVPPDIAVSCEAIAVPGKHRSGCSQSAIGWNTRSPVEQLEKVPTELKRSATP